jgi:predicted aminopeptidase
MMSLVAVCLLTSGCSTVGFYAQAVKGQAQIVHRQEPLARLVADTNTPPALRAKLERILELRRFAETKLALPANGHYLRYADLGRSNVVWNVHAAPEFSLEAKGWWYPVVGRLTYRGYFDESMARDYARRLQERGYDVHVGGVEAYSTLGWFRDPVLNTFIGRDEAGLADLIFHELAHQRFFVRGDTAFNEAFAVAVAREGVRRWLAAKGDPAALARWETAERCDEEFVGLVRDTRRELELLYQRNEALPDGQLRRHKAEILAGFERRAADWRTSSNCDGDYSKWFDKPVNNARLNTIATYYDLVPGFERLLAACDGDLERFYREVERLSRLGKEERRMHLNAPSR